MSSKTHLINQKILIEHHIFYDAWKELKSLGTTTDWRGDHIPRTFVEILDAVGLKAHVDEDGDVCSLEVDEMNDYHLDNFFKSLAPYVTSGSKLIFFNEYNIRTTYKFSSGRVTITSKDLSTLGDDDE